jgi:NADPH2:quinone reductase
VVPAEQAVELPDEVSDEVGACLGIPGITAHRGVFGDGPVTGRTVLVHGVLGGVGSLAAQLARWDGAEVIATVRHSNDIEAVDPTLATHVVALDQPDPAGQIRGHVPDGVHRIVELAFSDNADLDAAVAANYAVIAAYGTHEDRPAFPFRPMLWANITIRLLGSDDFPVAAKREAASALTRATLNGALSIRTGDPLPLDRIAEAHDRVEAGVRERVLISLPEHRGCGYHAGPAENDGRS